MSLIVNNNHKYFFSSPISLKLPFIVLPKIPQFSQVDTSFKGKNLTQDAEKYENLSVRDLVTPIAFLTHQGEIFLHESMGQQRSNFLIWKKKGTENFNSFMPYCDSWESEWKSSTGREAKMKFPRNNNHQTYSSSYSSSLARG